MRLPSPLDHENLEVNLTPLIDVVFVVLIMFIVIAPLLSTESVQLAPAGPHSEGLEHLSEQKVTIYLKEGNQILWQNQVITLENLKKNLILEWQKDPHAAPLLIPDKQASFGSFQQVKNAIEEVGFTQVHVILKPSFV